MKGSLLSLAKRSTLYCPANHLIQLYVYRGVVRGMRCVISFFGLGSSTPSLLARLRRPDIFENTRLYMHNSLRALIFTLDSACIAHCLAICSTEEPIASSIQNANDPSFELTCFQRISFHIVSSCPFYSLAQPFHIAKSLQ